MMAGRRAGEFGGRNHVTFDAVVDHFPRATDVREDHRAAHRHGLERRIRERLHGDRRQHEHIERGQHRPHVVDARRRSARDRVISSCAARRLRCSSSGPAPGDHQVRIDARHAQPAQRGQQYFLVLLRAAHAHGADQQRLGLDAERGAQALAGFERVGDLEVIRIDSVVDHGGVVPGLRVRLEPEAALRLRAVHGQIETRQHRTGTGASRVRCRGTSRCSPAPRCAADTAAARWRARRTAPGRDSPPAPWQAARARRISRSRHNAPHGKLAAALELRAAARRGACPARW